MEFVTDLTRLWLPYEPGIIVMLWVRRQENIELVAYVAKRERELALAV